MHVQTSHASHVGDRANNEDCAVVIVERGVVLLAVADGMGGHDDGELASAAAIDALAADFSSRGDDTDGYLRATLERAHREVLALGHGVALDARPRTTCVIALVDAGTVRFAHAGDSRGYLVRDGVVIARTRDHSHVEAMVADGEISEREAEAHPLRNIVERCLGGEEEPVEAELTGPFPLQAGDVVVVCSDGFWEGADVAAAAASLAGAADIDAELDRLVAAACAACAPHADNATAAALIYG